MYSATGQALKACWSSLSLATFGHVGGTTCVLPVKGSFGDVNHYNGALGQSAYSKASFNFDCLRLKSMNSKRVSCVGSS
jgi:hypothetical protein